MAKKKKKKKTLVARSKEVTPAGDLINIDNWYPYKPVKKKKKNRQKS